MENLTYPFLNAQKPSVIFVHLTKTGGTSVSEGLGFNKPNAMKGIKKHYSVNEIVSIVGFEYWARSFKFTFIRNPFARMVSLYQYKKYRISKGGKRRGVFRDRHDVSFNEWLGFMLNKAKNNPKHVNHFTQKKLLTDGRGEINLDFIGRYENLLWDYKYLTRKLNIGSKLIHKNKGEHNSSDYRSWYDTGSRWLVENFFAEDLEFFGYEF